MSIQLYSILQNEEDFYDIDLNEPIDNDKSCYDIYLSQIYNFKNNSKNKIQSYKRLKKIKKINETKVYKNWITELV